MHGDWSPGELRAALAAMQEQGFGQGDIAKLAGVNRSQVNRWARGENRPTYDKALQLARRTGTRIPEIAARFMSASGYPWDGKTDLEPEEPDVMPPGLRDRIRETLPPEEARRVEEVVEATLRGESLPDFRRRRAAGA